MLPSSHRRRYKSRPQHVITSRCSKVNTSRPSGCFVLTDADLMSQYRKLDDLITMRFNRTTAQFRDLEREGVAKGSVNDQACVHLWKDLVGASGIACGVLLCSFCNIFSVNFQRAAGLRRCTQTTSSPSTPSRLHLWRTSLLRYGSLHVSISPAC